MKNFSPAEVRALMRGNFGLFVERCFRYLNPNAAYQPNWHIDVMVAKLDACRRGELRRLIVNVPPRSLKSLIASVALPAWILGHNPSAQILCLCYALDLSEKLARDCLQVMQSDWYRELFPRTRLSKSKLSVAEFTTTAHGFRKATSVEGVITGRGGDFIIIDDPMKPEDAASETQRKRVNAWYGNTLVSRQNSKATGCIVLIMQRLHEDDLAGHVQENEPWEVVRFPAIAETDETYLVPNPYGPATRYDRKAGEPLHPEREPLIVLEEIRRTMGSYDFEAQYQQNPTSPTGGIIKRAWLKIRPPELWPAAFDKVYQSWDTANTASEFSNYSVCITVGVKGKNFFVLDVYRKRLEFPDLLRAVEAQFRKFSPCAVVVEEAASGVQLIQQLKAQGIYDIKAMKPEGDKEVRLYTQAAVFEGGYFFLPAGAPWLQEYVRELTAFPGGKFSDQVDATTQALAFIKGPGREPGFLEYVRSEAQRARGIGEPSIPLKAPQGVTEVHTISGRKITPDAFGMAWFTREEADHLGAEGWTACPEPKLYYGCCVRLRPPSRWQRVKELHGRRIDLDEDGEAIVTQREADELLRAGWKRV